MKMTIGELIERLSVYPQDAKVRILRNQHSDNPIESGVQGLVTDVDINNKITEDRLGDDDVKYIYICADTPTDWGHYLAYKLCK